jgi:hypothetical protein
MDEVQRFTALKEKVARMSDNKIRLEERFKTEKSKLEALLKLISAKGYDPKNLTDIRKEKEEAMKKMLGELETSVKETQAKLELIEVQ